MIEPLRISFEIDCPAAHAFEVWTSRIARWWPAEHTVSGTHAEVLLEPRVGGRIFERSASGEEHEWGEVTLWEPPRRLGYLWHIRRDRADGTDVTITFLERNSRTLVEIEHRGWERLGSRGPRWREANRAGWDGVLPVYIAACTETAHRA